MLVFKLIFLSLFLHAAPVAKLDGIALQTMMGEKNFENYADRGFPLVSFDPYLGGMSFQDGLMGNRFFDHKIFPPFADFNYFFNSELYAGLLCPNEKLQQHMEDIRYAYRLITLSYLMEGVWHMQMVSRSFGDKAGCHFNFSDWLKSCRPQSTDMQKFIQKLQKYAPPYNEGLPIGYNKDKWIQDYQKHVFRYYSHYRIDLDSGTNLSHREQSFARTCQQDLKLMTKICSEVDQLYGLSNIPDAYNLLITSNLINNFNHSGEAAGCLRRYSGLFARKELRSNVLPKLFKVIREQLYEQYRERFLQGRIFLYGADKEFEQKGLSSIHFMQQPFQVVDLNTDSDVTEKPVAKLSAKSQSPVKIQENKTDKSPIPKSDKPKEPQKSAFLQAADFRSLQDLEATEVDMAKFKLDYVFTLRMINAISDKLKSFMTRDALQEMLTHDKLGSKEAPVPLLFIKYMIDMEEHWGLFNLVAVLGDEFYVSNEIDTSFKTSSERIKLVYSDSNLKPWLIYIVRP